MGSFDPKAPEHQQSAFIKDPGRYVFAIVAIQRKLTRNKDESIWTICECIIGPQSGSKIRRLFMMEGKGTRWFADLLNAVKCRRLQDTMDDIELSVAIGRLPFAADCAKGDPQPGKTDRRTGEPLRYMEIMEVFPIDNQEEAELQRNNYSYGIPPESSIVVEEFKEDAERRNNPRPASGYGGRGNNSGGSRQGWGDGPPDDHPAGRSTPTDADNYIPNPADDGIPF